MLCRAVESRRVVIELSRAEIEFVIDSDVDTAAKRTGKSGSVIAVLNAKTINACRANEIVNFCARVRRADKSVSKGFESAFVCIVFDLNAAEKVIKRKFCVG